MAKSKFLVYTALLFLAVQTSTAYEDDLDPMESSIYEKVSSSNSDKYQFHNSDRNVEVSEETGSSHNTRPNPNMKKQTQSQSYYSPSPSTSSSSGNGNSKIRNRNGDTLLSSAEYSAQLKNERVELGRGESQSRLDRLDSRVSEIPERGRGDIPRGESRGRISESRGDNQGRLEGRGGGESRGESRLVESRYESQGRGDSRGESPISRLDSRGESPVSRLDSRGEGPGSSRLDSRGEGQVRVEGRGESRVVESRIEPSLGRIEPRIESHGSRLDERDEIVVETMKPSASTPSLAIAESQQQPQTVPLLPRVTLRHDGVQGNKKCGGFSVGALGGCCKSCAKLGYNKGCWCRQNDCLCYDS